MDVLSAILTCSLHHDDAMVRAIADNAHDNPLAVLVPEVPELASSTPATTREAATAQLRDALAQGFQPLVGLMQVPAEWASSFGRSAEDLFDPCINISIGTAMLSAFEYACVHPSGRATPRPATAMGIRKCTARRYAVAVRVPELPTIIALEAHYPSRASALPTDAPIFPLATSTRAWGPDWLFVPAASAQVRP